MVNTGVAATAYFQLMNGLDGRNQLYWRQVSNAITCRATVNAVDSQLFTATWSATTYKYLRIRESGGNIFWDSSSDRSSWTNRAVLANPFAITSLYVQFAAACGNVASPGSLKLDDVNSVFPVPSATWRETTADWSISNRLRPITLASDGGKQGVIVVADAMDATSRTLSGNLHYYGGPLGSASGGYLALTEYASLALAQASPFVIPISGRVDLPALRDARYMRLYHRSIDGSAHLLYEFVPRRMVQADDIEAESIRAINISAGAITADKISVVNLQAVAANMGSLHMDGPIDITTGSLVGGGGVVTLDASGLAMTAQTATNDAVAYKFTNGAGGIYGGLYGYLASGTPAMLLQTLPLTGNGSDITIDSRADATNLGSATLRASNGSHNATINCRADTTEQILFGGTSVNTLQVWISGGLAVGTGASPGVGAGDLRMTGGLNVGSATGATAGQIASSGAHQVPRASGAALFGIDGTSQGSALTIANNGTATPFGGVRNFSGLLIISETAVTGNAAMFLIDGGGTVTLIGAAGASWSVTAATASKTNVYITGTVVTIENKLGSTATYNIMALRTHTS